MGRGRERGGTVGSRAHSPARTAVVPWFHGLENEGRAHIPPSLPARSRGPVSAPRPWSWIPVAAARLPRLREAQPLPSRGLRKRTAARTVFLGISSDYTHAFKARLASSPLPRPSLLGATGAWQLRAPGGGTVTALAWGKRSCAAHAGSWVDRVGGGHATHASPAAGGHRFSWFPGRS